ncbi:FG-GAP-like repeat-containing protein [Ekhidna sp.]|uniref:FG-GAP-like repeat-containing protein n=1 Tax=Ekhidna sp. TaxID=2608089 RepID=UPI003CCBEFC4
MNIYHLTLRATKEKYLKFKNRLERSISSGAFDKLPRRKKNTLISRVDKLRSRLENASLIKKGMVAAGSAAFLPTIALSQVIALPPPDPKLRFEKSDFDLNQFGTNRQVEVVDIDSDGDMDVLLSTTSRGFVLKSDGRYFEREQPSALEYMRDEFYVGDVDGDLDDDIVFRNGNNFFLAINDGEGDFELTEQVYYYSDSSVPGVIGREYSPEDVDLVDFDSDGDLDLVIADSNTSLKVFKNDGNGNFDSASYLATGANYGIVEFEFGNFDDDEDLDLVFNTSGGDYDQFHVVENTAVDGDPVFSGSYVELSNSTSSNLKITTVDIDGDGDLDIFTNQSYNENLYLNQSYEGTNFLFNEPTIEGLSFSGSVVDVAIADLDGDGTDDLLLAFGGLTDDPHVAIFEDGVLSATDRNLNGDIGDATRAWTTVAIGDLDGDGLNDIVGGESSTNDPYIYFDRSAPFVSGFIGDNIIDENSPAGEVGVFVFDDFHDDAVTSSVLSGDDADSFTWDPATNTLTSNEVWDWEAKGSEFDLKLILSDGIKTRTENLGIRLKNLAEKGHGLIRENHAQLDIKYNEYLENFTPVDYDVDGDQDLFFGEEYLLVNNEFGFKEERVSGFSSGASEVAFIDIDQDGDLDVFGKDNYAIYLLENVDESQSYNGWRTFDNYFVGAGSFSLIAGDFDNDGQKEVALIDYSSGSYSFQTIEVFDDGRTSGLQLDQDISLKASGGGGYMDGYGRFTDIAIADFDGDGYDDLLVITQQDGPDPGTDAIFPGTESSGFDTSNMSSLTTDADNGLNKVEVGDLNGDGDPDIAFMRSNGFSVVIDVMLNDGSGGFTSDQTLDVGGQASTADFDMKLGDMDGDGVLDIVASATDSNQDYSLKIWNNDGEGNFSDLQTISDISGYEFELMDIDGDDDLDVIVRESYYGDYGFLNVHFNDNLPPTDISLSSTSFDEHLANDTEVATISVTDANTTDMHEFTLVEGDGTNDAHNNFFAVDGNSLVITRDVSAENYPTLNILLAANDGENIYKQALTLTVNQVNLAPTAITAPDNFDEGTEPGTSIGTLSATDDGVETVTFALATGDGTNDADNGSFLIDGDQLIITEESSFETKSTYNIYLSASDIDGNVEQAFTINVNDLNQAPTGITLSTTNIEETVTAGSAIATIDADDPNAGDTHEFSLVSGDGSNDVDNDKFVIEGDQLIIKQNVSFETQSSYNIHLSASDSEGNIEQAFTITVNNTNELPTGITLSATTIDEEVTGGSAIATIDATDANTGDEHEFALVVGDGTNDADNSKFIIDGDQLVIKSSPDFDVQSTYNIYLSASDSEGSFEQAFTLTVNEFVSSNNAPTGILLSSTSFDEGIDGGSAVASLAAEDLDAGDTHTFSFATGDGSNDIDNSKFLIDGDQLVIKSSPSFEVQSSYNIYLSTSDGEDSFEQAFNLTVNNLNSAPTGIQLSSTSFDEGIAGGSSVATLTADDADAGDTHTFTLATGDGTNDADNNQFVIDGDQLVIKSSPNFETQASYNIYVSAADSEGSVMQAFELTVNNVNEVPTAITLSSTSMEETTPAGSAVATIDATDANESDQHEFELISGDGTNDADNGKFLVEGDQLIIKQDSRFETQASYSIYLSASDSEGSIAQAFVIDVVDVNQAPNSISLSITSLDESVSPGSTAATISTTDPNAGDTHTFSLVEGDGTNDQHNDLFVISGNKLILIEEVEFDNLQSISINIEANDGEESYTQSFTLIVNEVLGLADEVVNTLGVYPNPGGEKFTINLENNYRGNVQIRVIDLAGKEVYNLSEQKVSESFTYDVDMTRAESGIYVIELVADDEVISQRWVKE